MSKTILALLACVLTSCGSNSNNNPVIETRLESKSEVTDSLTVTDSDGHSYSLNDVPHSLFDRIRQSSKIDIQFDEHRGSYGGYTIVHVDDSLFQDGSSQVQRQTQYHLGPSTHAQEEDSSDEQQPAHQRRSSQSNSITITGMPGGGSGSISIWQTNDKNGSVSFQDIDGIQHAVIKNANGQLIFEGDVTTKAQRAAMPPNARNILELAERGQN